MSNSCASVRILPAFLVMMTCAGCAAGLSPAVNKRTLPPPANVVMAPVAVPPLAVGKDARVVLAEHRSALKAANGRLVRSRAIYGGVRKTYGAVP